nr:heparinase II/III family protein [Pseudoduganella dura]
MGVAQAAPTIEYFYSDSNHVVPGQSINLYWKVEGATRIILNGLAVTGNSTNVVIPSAAASSAVSYKLDVSDIAGNIVSKTITPQPGKMLNGERITEAYVPGCTFTTADFFTNHFVPRIEPRDCTEVKVTQPIFVWPQVPDMATGVNMTFTLSRVNSDNTRQVVYTTNTTTPRIILPSNIMTPGSYIWKVSYINRNNQAKTSNERRFIFNEMKYANMPAASAVIAAVMARPHPRVLPRDANKQPISAAILQQKIAAGLEKPAFDKYFYQAKQVDIGNKDYTNSVVLPEPATKEQAFNVAKAQMNAVEWLAFASHLDTSLDATAIARYRTKAIDRMVATATWKTGLDGVTSEYIDDQANRVIMSTLALGLDLLQNQMSEAQINTVIVAINERLQITTTKLDGNLNGDSYYSNLSRKPLDSHNLAAVHYVTQTLMYASGIQTKNYEIDANYQQLAKSWERMVTTMGAWGGSADSALGDGTFYGWMAMEIYAPMLATYRIIAGANLHETPPFANIVNNFIAFTPRHRIFDSVMGAFGDATEKRGTYLSYAHSTYRLFAHLSRREIDQWYATETTETVPTVVKSIYSFLMYGIDSQISAPGNTPILPASYLFEDAGTVAMHSISSDPLRSSLYFRSSKLGSFSHNHADNNAFTFVSRGEDIFISGGIYPSYGGEVYQATRRATRFKNAITFDDGLGQAYNTDKPNLPVFSMQASGKLINYYHKDDDDKPWSIATGDATNAYRQFTDKATPQWQPLLNKAIRTVAYNRKAGIAVIYDYAESPIPRRWEANFQTLKPVSLPSSTSDRMIRVRRKDGSDVCVVYHGYNGKWTTESMGKYYPEPTDKDGILIPETTQFHTTYTTDNLSSIYSGVTVITEDCNDADDVPVKYIEGLKYTLQFNGKALHFDREKVQISE